MTITFDGTGRKAVWLLIKPFIRHKVCFFCGTKITGKNFAMAFKYGNDMVVGDGKLPCLIGLSDILRKYKGDPSD